MISPEELEKLFIDTLTRASSSVLSRDDETIAYDIFEEFDVGVVSFLHDDSLKRLLDNNCINFQIENLCRRIRMLALALLQKQREVDFVKKDPGWAEIFSLSDEALALKKIMISLESLPVAGHKHQWPTKALSRTRKNRAPLMPDVMKSRNP